MQQPAINFFHSKVCHVCKLTSNEIELKYCGKCHLIGYCSVEHQKMDWKKHKRFCTVLIHVNNLNEYKEVARTLSNNRLQLRHIFTVICEKIMKRCLTGLELGMIHYENKCSVCEERENLTNCQICLSYSSCPNHYNSLMHDFDCQNLKLCLDSHIFKSRPYFVPDFEVRKDYYSFNDMESFINNKLILHPSTSLSEKTFVSDLLTRPLTIGYALSIIKLAPELLKLEIVGSCDLEIEAVKYWKVLKQLKITENMQLKFIGPEITESQKKKFDWASIDSKSDFYHNCISNSDIPTAIVSFNCGLHEYEEDDSDMWGPSLNALLSRKVPIILTSFTLNEAVLDVARLRRIDQGLRVLQISNPYSSLSPIRDVESSGVFFVNSVLSILIPS